MKKFYCIIFDKYRSFKNPIISYILKKKLVLSIIYSKFGNEDEKILKEDESVKIKNSWFDKNMAEENISQEFRLKEIISLKK